MKRNDETRKLANELLDLIETQSASIDSILMKCSRLARLLRDTDAQTWFNYEIRGYPEAEKFNFETLGNTLKYAKQGGRIFKDDQYYKVSLPNIEAEIKSISNLMMSHKLPQTGTKVKDFTEKNATVALLTNQLELFKNYKERYNEYNSLFISIISGIHSYLTDLYLSIEFGDVVESIFETARSSVDEFVRIHCPKAAEQLLSIDENIREDNSESRALALTSCRRLLMTVADSLFPPQSEKWKDSHGNERKVGNDEYKNRLLAFIDKKMGSDSSFSLIETEIEHLSSRLDAVYEKNCKGVHANVSIEEARLAVIHSYLFLGEVARFT